MQLTATSPKTECPPEDTYVFEFIDYEDLGERPDNFKEGKLTYQILATFKLVNFDFDPDVDERDWNGFETREYLKYAAADVGGANFQEIWNAPRAKARPFLCALSGHDIEEGEQLDLDELLGKRMKATVKLKDNGYPKLESPVALRNGRKKAAPKPEIADDGAFDDDE